MKEMDKFELMEIDGGGPYSTAVRFLEYLGVLEALEAFAEGFVDGVSDGYNAQQLKK